MRDRRADPTSRSFSLDPSSPSGLFLLILSHPTMPLFRPTPYLLAGRPKTAPHEIPPPSSSLPAPRSADQADKYFRRVANENVKPGRGMRLLSVGGWVVGGGEFRVLGSGFGFSFFLLSLLFDTSSGIWAFFLCSRSIFYNMQYAYTILLRFLCAFLFSLLFCFLAYSILVFHFALLSLSPHITSSHHLTSTSLLILPRSGMHVYGPLCRFRGQGACFLTGEFRISFLGLVLCFRRFPLFPRRIHIRMCTKGDDHVETTISRSIITIVVNGRCAYPYQQRSYLRGIAWFMFRFIHIRKDERES